MNVKITTLVENSVGFGGSRGLIGEHGLAFLIETGGRRILFDTGQNIALENNARVLGSDLTNVDTVVLSHGHYDHTGGLKYLLQCNSHFALFAHPDVFVRKLEKRRGRYKDIGIPVARDDLLREGVKLILAEKPLKIAPGIRTSGQIPLQADFESATAGFFIKKEDHMTDDTFPDDLALIIKTAKGPVVVLGCSHRGVINTLSHVTNIIGQKRIYAVMGGLHLVKTTGEKLETIIGCLERFNLEKIIVGHCTGTHAVQALYNRFKDKVSINTVGNVSTF